MAFSFGRKHRLGQLAQDEAKWITVHPNGKGMTKGGDKAKGQPVLIEGSTGEVLGGMGGKFNGRHISAVPKQGKEEQHGAQMTIERSHQTQGGQPKASASSEQSKPEAKPEETVYQKLSRKGVAEIVEFVPWLSDYLNSKDNRVLDVSSKELRSVAMAQVEVSSRGDQKLFLSLDWFKDEKKLLEQMKRDVESRWAMPCAPENYLSYTIAHEMGHVIHNAFYEKTLENRIQSGELDEWDVRWRWRKLRSEALKNLRSDILRVAKEESKEKTQKAIIEKHMSEYGRSSPAEFIAEAVANAFCGNPNPIGNAMRKVLSQMRL